ncbi:hypothetical protein KDA_41930 [Dictyobacter alpinus]|uniref:Polymerase nucleotidyl transferase domain-containing protein n=1 Tax=Dictyobacter alpinus TaxID=2014873 RepID=A0A402BBJ9_9CHLR|nr:nucleotidyltransferase domain-containing protein [Dictyobacter alpinus]GCE28709.1 hypothetical protein KDA_41930 [Dictyobacter alpinus]
MDYVEQLCSRAVQAFAEESEVVEIGLFGSYAQRTNDRYSDIDLHVVSHDFDTTMSHFMACLSKIGRVLVAFPLTVRVGYAAYMVLFEDYPLYNKLDINIADRDNTIPFAPTTCIYRRDTVPPYTVSSLLPSRFEEPLNLLYDSYLGALRYMKYRQREKHFSAYKFYRAQLERLLVIWYQDMSHDHAIARLGILEYQQLDTHPSSADMQRYLYPANEQMMDQLYLELLQMLTHTLPSTYSQEQREVLASILEFLRSAAGGFAHDL